MMPCLGRVCEPRWRSNLGLSRGFDASHDDVVLRDGPLRLDMLDAQVTRWREAQPAPGR